MSSTRLPGHGLQHEGKPFRPGGELDEQGPWVRVYGSHTGTGLCECGQTSPELDTDSARKAWHRGHKADVRAQQQEGEA